MLIRVEVKKYDGIYFGCWFYFDCGRRIFVTGDSEKCSKALLERVNNMCEDVWGEPLC